MGKLLFVVKRFDGYFRYGNYLIQSSHIAVGYYFQNVMDYAGQNNVHQGDGNNFSHKFTWHIDLPSLTIKGKDAEKLEITVYPTIIIVYEHSRKIFMGDLSHRESFLKKRFEKTYRQQENSSS